MSLPSSAQVIELKGPDAEKFAQAQFCNDVSTLTPGASQLNAWLNPQGRVRRLFHLLRTDESRYLLLLRGGTAEPILATLRMFVLRLKVQVSALPGWHWHEVDADETAETAGAESWAVVLPNERRLLLRAPEISATARISAKETFARDIDAGLPWLPEHALEQALPSWMEFSRLGAISHAKGCYPGQEIVARLHFRGGGDKRVLACVETSAATPGSQLRDGDGGEAGLLLQSVSRAGGGWRALAVVKRESALAGGVLYDETQQPFMVVKAPWHDAAQQ